MWSIGYIKPVFWGAKTLSGGVLALRKAPNVRFAPDTTTSPTTTTTTSTTRSGRTRRAPRRLHFDGFFTNAGEHQLLRHLRDADPELYELKLLEWDYVLGRNDIDETTHPDLDDPDASELFFTVGGTENEPATDIDGNDVVELRGGAHHQPWLRDGSEL